MALSDPTASAFISAIGALIGGGFGALLTYIASSRAYGLELRKLISTWTKSEEIEKARIAAYRDLWRCLGGISTFDPGEIVKNLPLVQERLYRWYYEAGGGLFLMGADDMSNSSKAMFFEARNLQSMDASEIWTVFHNFRAAMRQDLGIFESEAAERAFVESVKKRLNT